MRALLIVDELQFLVDLFIDNIAYMFCPYCERFKTVLLVYAADGGSLLILHL